VLRLAYWLESTELPFMEAPLFDSGVYLRQAASIRAGDFGDATLVAFGPLYGWFLHLFGEAAIPLQLALGVATAVLVERIASRHSREAGVVALALWIGYALPLFYETKIVSEPLGLFLLVAAVFALDHPSREPRWLAGGGALLGLAMLARPNLLFAAPFVVLAALLPREPGGSEAAPPARPGGERARPRALRAGAAALGVALVLAANGGWNLAHVGRFVPLILVSRTAGVSSAHGWTGSLAIFGTSDRPPSAWDVVRQAEVTLGRAQAAPASRAAPIDPAGWLAAAPSKLARTFSDVETTFEYGFYGERTEIPALAWQPISMGTLLMLGLVGAILLLRTRGWPAVLAHAPLLLCAVVVTVLFHPSSRYRLPMIVPLVVLGAIGLVELWRFADVRRRNVALAAIALASLVLAFRHLTHPLADPAMWQVRVAEGEALRGDVDASRARLTRAYELSDEGDAARARIDLLRRERALPPPPP
jgi:hypothetical protein